VALELKGISGKIYLFEGPFYSVSSLGNEPGICAVLCDETDNLKLLGLRETVNIRKKAGLMASTNKKCSGAVKFAQYIQKNLRKADRKNIELDIKEFYKMLSKAKSRFSSGKKALILNITCLLFIVFITGCNDTEIYITNQDGFNNDIASCDSMVFRLFVFQNGMEQKEFSTMVIDNRICFRIINTENLDFEREVSLRLEVFKENRNPLCSFRKNIIYKTSNVKLKKINGTMKIYEIDINSFYPIN